MRKFFFASAIIAVFFALSAQDNTNDLYQQYLNQYNNNQPAQAEPAKPAEPAPAQPAAEPAKPAEAAPAAQPAEEKKEEAAQSEEKKEEAAPAEEKKEEAAQSEEKKEEAAEGDNKIDPFETKPFFSADAFMALSNSIYTFGGSVMPHSSYRFSIDNAVVDLKGGNRMFNGRILFDLAKGLKTTKDVEFNYDHDSELPTDYENPLENVAYPNDDTPPSALDILKDVSFSMVHPSYRNGNGTFGLNVELKAGLFGMPFGIEGGYDHEITYAHSAIKSEFLGGAFRDVGASLGVDLLLGNKMDLDVTLFVFNGKNETMLDGEDRFKDPAFGFDLRYKYDDSKLYATAAFSLVVGSAYMGYDEDTKGGIFDTTNNTYLDENNRVEENLILKNDDEGRNDYAINKKNVIFAVGADIGYQINDDINVGLMGEFAYSSRSIFNPKANIYVGGQYYKAEDGARFIRDANEGVNWGKSTYDTFGFFAMPYAHLYWFDVMARFSYYKQPYLYTFVKDSDNTNMGVDFVLIYNFCDYAGVEFDYNYIRETKYGYDETYNKYEYYKSIYNTHVFTIALTGWFDFLWEEKSEESTEPEAAAE